MAKRKSNQSKSKRQPRNKNLASWRPGSESDKAKDVGAPGDFGVPVGAGPTRDRDYINENAKLSDPGAAKPFAWEEDGVRDHGAGMRNEGTGSGSEGDIDTDIIGFGAGGAGLAATAPGDARPGPDDSDGTSNEFASPVPKVNPDQVVIEPAQGRNQVNVHEIDGPSRMEGTVVQGQDVHSDTPHQGADAATNPAARGDDSFAGEISSGEAMGQDLGVSPSSDTQGLGEDGDKDFDHEG